MSPANPKDHEHRPHGQRARAMRRAGSARGWAAIRPMVRLKEPGVTIPAIRRASLTEPQEGQVNEMESEGQGTSRGSLTAVSNRAQGAQPARN